MYVHLFVHICVYFPLMGGQDVNVDESTYCKIPSCLTFPPHYVHFTANI